MYLNSRVQLNFALFVSIIFHFMGILVAILNAPGIGWIFVFTGIMASIISLIQEYERLCA